MSSAPRISSSDEAIVARAFGFQSVADRLRRAAEFRQRMGQVVGRIEAVDFEPDIGPGHRIQHPLQPLHIGSLLGLVDEALVPKPCGRRRLSHGRLRKLERGRTKLDPRSLLMDLTQAHVAKSLQFFGIAHQCPNVPVRTRALSICTGMCTTA
jgi:hypothetical protein